MVSTNRQIDRQTNATKNITSFCQGGNNDRGKDDDDDDVVVKKNKSSNCSNSNNTDEGATSEIIFCFKYDLRHVVVVVLRIRR